MKVIEIIPSLQVCDNNNLTTQAQPQPQPQAQNTPECNKTALTTTTTTVVSDDVDKDRDLNSFPPGYRFSPTHSELIKCYLENKVLNRPLPPNRIVETDIYQHNPEFLAVKYKPCRENEWYFFTPRERKYPKGNRPKRAAGDGYWKASGADKPVKFKGTTIGFRKALVFYKGKARKGDKTDWIMHEYRVTYSGPSQNERNGNNMRLDDTILCRIYERTKGKSIKVRTQDEDDIGVPSTSFSTDIENKPVENFDFKGTMDGPMEHSDYYMHQSTDGDHVIGDPYPTSFPSDNENKLIENFDDYYMLDRALLGIPQNNNAFDFNGIMVDPMEIHDYYMHQSALDRANALLEIPQINNIDTLEFMDPFQDAGGNHETAIQMGETSSSIPPLLNSKEILNESSENQEDTSTHPHLSNDDHPCQ